MQELFSFQLVLEHLDHLMKLLLLGLCSVQLAQQRVIDPVHLSELGVHGSSFLEAYFQLPL